MFAPLTIWRSVASKKRKRAQGTNVADRAAADRAPGPGMAAPHLSRFHLEIGEGDAATGKGDTVLLAPALSEKSEFEKDRRDAVRPGTAAGERGPSEPRCFCESRRRVSRVIIH